MAQSLFLLGLILLLPCSTIAWVFQHANRPTDRMKTIIRSSPKEESRQERQLRRERARREKYDEEVRNPGDAEAGSDSPIAELGSLTQQIPCPCQSGSYYGMCCQPVIETVKKSVAGSLPELDIGPEELLRARYTAYVREDADFVILTTHYNHPEYTTDVEGWRRELIEFIRCVTFRRFEVKEYTPVNDTMAFVKWSARMKVLPDVLSPEKVQTKEFTERSIFLFEDGRWWYAGGDEDFEPTNELVDDKPSPRPRSGDDAPKKKAAFSKPKSKAVARK